MTDLTTSEREPLAIRAAITAAVTAAVHAAVVLGLLHIDKSAEAAIGAAVDAVGLVALILWSRVAVTANAKVIARVTNDGKVVAGDAAITPTGTELPAQVVETSGATIVGRVAVKPGLAADVLPH